MTGIVDVVVVADAAVLTRSLGTEVPLALTVPSHEARLTVAAVVIHQLDAVCRALGHARVRQALVDVPFAPCAHVAWLAEAFKPTNLVNTRSSIMASSFIAVIGVDLTQLPQRSVRTGTLEAIHLVMTDSSILTRVVWFAVINIVLAVETLEAWPTGAGVGSHVIVAGGTIHAGLRVTLPDLVLAVGAGVAWGTLTAMGVANVVTLPFVETELGGTHILAGCGCGTGHHFHITQQARPSQGANTLVAVLGLLTHPVVEAGGGGAPVYQVFALFARVAVLTVAREEANVVTASATILAWV